MNIGQVTHKRDAQNSAISRTIVKAVTSYTVNLQNDWLKNYHAFFISEWTPQQKNLIVLCDRIKATFNLQTVWQVMFIFDPVSMK